jgi:hypothetical protein
MAGPNFAIKADAGSMTVMFSHLFSKGGFWDAGAGVTQPVFDGEKAQRVASGRTADAKPKDDHLRQREIQVLYRFVDLGGVLVAHGDAIHAGILKRELHGGLAIGTAGE